MNKYQRVDVLKINDQEALILLKNLSRDIKIYNKAYYKKNNPLISDAEYDYIFNLALEIEKKFKHLILKDNPSLKLGFYPSKEFKKVEHKISMLSLNNAFDFTSVKDFIIKVKDFLRIDYFPVVMCEPKVDGVSFSALFKDGVLTLASTRGDGLIGEDVTANIKEIKDFPQQILNSPDIIEVRGEIYIEKHEFLKLNKNQKELGLRVFTNPRNAASGSLRQINPKITGQRFLKYFVYSIGECSEKLHSQDSLLSKLKSIGFQVNNIHKLAFNEQGLIRFYERLKIIRNKLSYEIDGVVCKINDFTFQKRLGSDLRSPRFAIAYKFPPSITKTRLINININVGRTGILTPIAELDPINIGGVRVSKSTLHNIFDLVKKDIRIGDYVFLKRSGDVIPQIISVDLSLRCKSSIRFAIPTNCSSCGSILSYIKEKLYIRCENSFNCYAQLYERICHFVSRDAMNIQGLGKKQVLFLLQNKIIKNPASIFELEGRKSELMLMLNLMQGWGERSIDKLFANINKARSVSLDKFIYALGIRTVGKSNSIILARTFCNITNFIDKIKLLVDKNKNIYESLKNIHGIGSKVLRELNNFFSFYDNMCVVNKLISMLIIYDYPIAEEERNPLFAKMVTFTGTMSCMSRLEAKIKAEALGAIITNDILPLSDFLVVGNKPSKKLKKAQRLGIKVVNEKEWIKILEGVSINGEREN